MGGGSAVALFGYLGTNREMDVKMVEIAVGILAKEPTDPIKPVREWAVDVLSEYSDVSLSPLARAALLENPIEIDTLPIDPDKLLGLKALIEEEAAETRNEVERSGDPTPLPAPTMPQNLN